MIRSTLYFGGRIVAARAKKSVPTISTWLIHPSEAPLLLQLGEEVKPHVRCVADTTGPAHGAGICQGIWQAIVSVFGITDFYEEHGESVVFAGRAERRWGYLYS